MKYIFIILLIHCVFADIIYVQKNKVLFFEYFNYKNNSISIHINNNAYRESSILPKENGNFAVLVNSGIYNIQTEIHKNNNFYEFNQYDVDYILYSKNLLKDILIYSNAKWKVIDSIDYNEKVDHILYIASTINFFGINNFNYNIRIVVNNIPIIFENKDSSTFNFFTTIYNTKGIYNIRLEVQNLDNNNICSCPSIGNGFISGRHLTAWIYKNHKSLLLDPVFGKLEENSFIEDKQIDIPIYNISEVYSIMFYENEQYINKYIIYI